ncbi:MAG: hypothetical protein AB1758_30575 [Candidatus Eremiobacterota bacterium]
MKRRILWLLLAAACGVPSGPSEAEKAALCQKNLEHLWEPLEFYMSDHQGQYPPRLEDLATARSPALKEPYVKEIPPCPPGWSYAYETAPGRYTLICRGNFRAADLEEGYPRMTSEMAPTSKP